MTDSDFFDVCIILYFRDGNIVLPGIIILFIRRSRISVPIFTWGWTCYWHTSLYSGVYKYFLVIYPLNSYVGLMISLECTISVVISGCQFSFLFFLISFDLSDSVLLLNYLLAGLLSRVRLFANLSISAGRPYSVWTLLCNLHSSCLSTSIRLSIGFQSFWDLMITGLLWIFPFKINWNNVPLDLFV